MKKILLALDGSNFSTGAFEFARRLNEMEPVMVVGVFMPQVDYASLWSYAAAAGAGASGVFITPEEKDGDVVASNIRTFRELCEKNGIRYRVHDAFFDFVLQELKKETRFADVLILSGELFYKGVEGSDSFDYIRDALHASECPVLIVPEHYEFPENIILAYDGSEGSVYAIKQFSYIFPGLTRHKTLLVYAETEEKDFPASEFVTELVSQHFSDLSFYKLELDPKKYFSGWVGEKKASLLVSGSFSRSAFSEMFRKSFVADIIREHKVPVFIAHK